MASMNLMEAVQTCVQRPGYVAFLLERDKVIALSPSGYLMDPRKGRYSYARLNTVDALAVTWECWTPQQIEQMAAQAQADRQE
jgi:hypothetical protein